MADLESLGEYFPSGGKKLNFFGERESSEKEEEAQDLCWTAMDEPNLPRKMELAQKAIEIFPESVEARQLMAWSYYKLGDLDKAMEYAQLGVHYGEYMEKMYLIDGKLDWGFQANRPYLRALHVRMILNDKKKNYAAALSDATRLLRLNPNDNQGIRSLAIYYHFQAKDFLGVERLLEQYRKVYDEIFLYTDLLIYYWKFKQGLLSEKVLRWCLGNALRQNPYVLDQLLSPELKPLQLETFSSGDKQECAGYYAADLHGQEMWKLVPGSLEWLRGCVAEDGAKPAEDVFLTLLEQRSLLIHLKGGGSKLSTRSKDDFIGRARPDFRVPPRFHNPHQNGNAITVFEITPGWTDNGFKDIRYSDVVSVSCWKVISEYHQGRKPAVVHRCENCGKGPLSSAERKELSTCGRCKQVRYCSKDCQRSNWSDHKFSCKKY